MATKNGSSDTTPDNSPKYSHLITEEDKGRIPDTHRKFDSFPAGHQCDLTIADLPDDENDYGWTNHYENESRKRTNPDVTDEIVDELLTTGAVWGTPEDKWDDRYLVQKEMDGHEWTLVVADDGDCDAERWVLITIYSNYHGSVGTTNKYFDRLRARRDEE